MTTITQEIYRKNPSTIHEFHQLTEEIDDAITEIEMYQAVLTPGQIDRLTRMARQVQGKPSFDVSEVDKQYHLFLKMQEQVVDDSGNLKATATLRDIGAVVGSMTGLISLFLKAQKELDSIKAESDLKQAVLAAIKLLPEKSQKLFFDKLNEQ